MGKRGPLPKKDSLKALSGSKEITQADFDDLNKQFDPPIAPEHLNNAERKVWCETVKLLQPLRLLERIDSAILGAYCCSRVRWQVAEKALQDLGKTDAKEALLTIGASGNLVANPLITISRNAQADMVAYANELGMTPAARIKIQASPPKETRNPFEKLKLGCENAKKLVENSDGVRKVIPIKAEQE